MESFSECFSTLITNCRDNALEELRSNKKFGELKTAESDLRTKLEALISPEAQDILEDFMEAVVAVKGMECNRALLCGLTVSATIQRHYDASTPEYKAFAEEYL